MKRNHFRKIGARVHANWLYIRINCHNNNYIEYCNDSNAGTVRLENRTRGRVMVCWGGEWIGLAEDSIRTTKQAKVICKQCNFLEEGKLTHLAARLLNGISLGVEILEAQEGPPNGTIYCPWSADNKRLDNNSCTISEPESGYCGNNSNRTAAIECKTLSKTFCIQCFCITIHS